MAIEKPILRGDRESQTSGIRASGRFCPGQLLRFREQVDLQIIYVSIMHLFSDRSLRRGSGSGVWFSVSEIVGTNSPPSSNPRHYN